MSEPNPRENPSSPNPDETIIFGGGEPASGSASSQPTATPARPEIDTATEGFSGDLSSYEEAHGSGPGKPRRLSGTTSGFGSNLAASAASSQEPARPVTEIDELRKVLLSVEFISPEQWQQALDQAGEQPSVESVLAQLRGMPATWDPKAPLLTEYQCDEISAGRARELRFNQYLVLSLLGEGGMGKVFKARHIYLDAIHALKTIRRDRFGQGGTANPEVIHTMVKRFLGEFRGMAKLLVAKDPEHFAQVHDAGDADGIPYYAMEFIDGQSLDDMIRENTKTNTHPPLEESLLLFAEIADAVGTAHDLNIVHRDLTPRNIMITRRGRPKIIDFGIAKELKRDEETGIATAGLTELTTSGQQVGSRPYMSPEQHAGDIERVNFSTDVYVLSATLFQYLTLQLPFPGTTAMEVMLKHLAPDRPKPSSFRSDVPAELDEVIQKALAIEPADRYQNMGEFKEALLAAREIVANPLLSRGRPTPRPKRRPYAVLSFLGIIVAAGAYFALSGRREPVSVNDPQRAVANRSDRPSSAKGSSGANKASGPVELSRFDKLAKQIETLRSQKKHAQAITQCQQGLAEKGLSDLQRKKLIDDLLDSTAQEFVPPQSPEEAEQIVKIIEPYRGGSSTVQYAIDGLLSRAITETPVQLRDIIRTLVAGSKVGESPRSAAADRLKSWWNDPAIPFVDRLDSLSRLGELASNDALVLAQSGVGHAMDTAQQLAAKDRTEATTLLDQARQIVAKLSLPDMQPQLDRIGQWELVLSLPTLDPTSSPSASRFVKSLPKTRADLTQLDASHAELRLPGATPSEQAAQSLDLLAKEILSSTNPDELSRIEPLNERAVSLGIADRVSALATHFGSQAFKEMAELVKSPDFDLNVLESRSRELGDRLNEDQRGVLEAIKSVRLKAYVAAAARFREIKLNTNVPPWSTYRAEASIEELSRALSQPEIDREAIGRSLGELETVYGIQGSSHPRLAALQAKHNLLNSQWSAAAKAIQDGLGALSSTKPKLWSEDVARQELRDAARLVMDQAIATASQKINAGENPSEILTQAEAIASLRLVDGNPLGLDDDGKSAFRSRSSRLSFLRGEFDFNQRRYAEATEQFRKIDSAILGSDAYKDASAYWLISQTLADGQIPSKLVSNEDSPHIPQSIVGKPEEVLLRSLWEMARDLGTASQTQTLASAATYSKFLAEYLNLWKGSPPENRPTSESIARVLEVYLTSLSDLPRRTQGWERSINLGQLVDPKIPDDQKSLRQVEAMTRDLVAIAEHGREIIKEEELATLRRVGLLMSTKPVGIYSSVVKETPIGENTPYKYYVFYDTTFNDEFTRYMDWSADRIRAIGPEPFASDATIGPFIAVWNRARMRFAYFRQDWSLCLQCARLLADLDAPLRDEQPETEVANLCDAFFHLIQGKPVDEITKIIQETTDPTLRRLPGKDYTPTQLLWLKRWRSMFLLMAHLNGAEIPEADRQQSLAEIEGLLTTWNGKDSATLKWPIWERPIVLGYYQKYTSEAKPAIETLARLPVPRLSPNLEKSLSEAATSWKVPPKS